MFTVGANSFFLLLLPSQVFPLLWHKLPTGAGPALEQVLHVVQFLQGISTWLGSSLAHPFSGTLEHLCLSPSLTLIFFSVSHSFLFYFVRWHFLPFLKCTFPEVFSVVLRGSAVSGRATVGTSWAWGRATPGLFPQKLLLQPLCCQQLAGYNQ